MFERHHQPLLPRARFLGRMAKNAAIAAAILAGALVIGVAGFLLTGTQGVVDAFLQASMLLGGMGPVGELHKAPRPAKLFAAVYALFAGVVFLVSIAVLLSPVVHRLMHRFHLAEDK